MKQGNRFLEDMLDWDLPERAGDRLWRAGPASSVEQRDGGVVVRVPMFAKRDHTFYPDEDRAPREVDLLLRAYGRSVVRVTVDFAGADPPADEDNVMLQWDPTLLPEPLHARAHEGGWDILDSRGKPRARMDTSAPPMRKWSDLVQAPPDALAASVLPDGEVEVPLHAHDAFYPHHLESVGLGYVERDETPARSLVSVHAASDECFAGTGERFAKMDLAGQTILLENTDGLGVNSRRAYKNVPLYVSSRGYGMLLMTSAHARLSLADISTRAAQALVEEGRLDLFFLGGGNLERVLYNYRRVTGFPAKVPLWSYGVWMSRMTYYSAEETFEVARGLREGEYPCDIIHLDTGWFPENWKCEWEFSEEKFPRPAEYMARLREQGFRVSLWNYPKVEPGNKYYDTARQNRYIAPRISPAAVGKLEYAGDIDFSYPKAVQWYQGLLEGLLSLGAVVIKTDFGEDIDMDTNYLGMSADKLHNLYVLLYQKAAFEVTERVTGEPMVWARGAWTGCQRYPVHWAGDGASTWDGLAGTIRGGLHLGLSGFGFWSHDVTGFHGSPDFMNSWPFHDLYIRWTQLGVFTSHMRYHGTNPREPYHYPEAAPTVRRWLRLRYALIPYLVEQGEKVTRTGYPLLRALVLHHDDDPVAWHVDDQFFCGDDLLVAPVLNPEGVRNVYLPRGQWVDLWSGEKIEGPVMLKKVPSPLHRIPVFARHGASIPVYPSRVQCTDDMDLSLAEPLRFDDRYQGLASSVLGEVTGLE